MALRYAVQNGNWSNPATWDGGTLPGDGDDVYTDGKVVTIDIDLVGQYRPASLYARNRGGGTNGGYFNVNTTRQIGEPGYPVYVYGPDVNNYSHGCIDFSATSATLTVYGEITGGSGYCYGIYNSSTGTVTVTGNVIGGSGEYSYGIRNSSSGTVTVTGNATGGSGSYACGTSNNSTGTIIVTGNITGGSGGSAYGIVNWGSGTVTVTGNVSGGINGNAYGINNTSLGIVTINGSVRPTATSQNANAVWNNSTGYIIINGDVYGGRGNAAVYANNGYIRINGDLKWDETYSNAPAVGTTFTGFIILNGKIRHHYGTTGYFGYTLCTGRVLLYNGKTSLTEYAESATGGMEVTGNPIYHYGESLLNFNHPSESDVRFGVTYGPDNQYTGSCRVPPPQSVAYGVPVDDTTGTAALTPELVASAVWDALRSNHTETGTFGAVSEWAGSGGGGAADWTATEKAQIRHRLGIDGDRQEPTSSSSLVSGVWSYSSRSLTATVDVNMSQALPASPTDDTVGKALKQASARLDASISSRLAAGSYTAPDNAGIAAIKTKTDQLQFSSGRVIAHLSDPVMVDMSQSLPSNPTDGTIGKALTQAATQLDVAVSTRLATASYTAPDNTSIAAIKSQTDKLRFDINNYVYAIADVHTTGVQVVVQPLTARVLSQRGDGGTIILWQHARIRTSWHLNANLESHDLRLIIFSPDDPSAKACECSGSEISVTVQSDSSSVVTVDAADTKVPAPGSYKYILRDQTTDAVLIAGRCIVKGAPDAEG
jgi:hypothetical protein